MAYGRRCGIGCESWPDDDEYAVCPRCGEETERYRNLNPLDEDEARSIKLHLEFEEFYEARCAERGVTVDGELECV
jgi:hypothetical protein